MTDWAAAAADVADGIAEAGFAAAIVRKGAPTGPEYNPTPGTPAEHACTVVQSSYRQHERDGTLIQAHDLKFLVSTDGLDIVPTPEDELKVGGETYQIIDVAPLAPGGVTIMYTMQVRR